MKIKFKSIANIEAITILLLMTGGVTIASMTEGSQSAPYYSVVLISVLVATASLLRQRLHRSLLIGVFGIIFVLLIYLLQGLLLPLIGIEFHLRQSSLRVGAIVVILIVSVALANMRSSALDRAVLYSWALLLAVLIYGVFEGGALRIEIGVDRFSGAGFREVIWSEIALGTLVLAFLTNRPTVVIITFPVVAVIILATQMRTVGIAALVSTLIYSTQFFYFGRGKVGKVTFLFFGALATVSMLLLFESIINIAWTLLLLDNPYRGLESGFSGRFENIAAGWSAYLESPFIGQGVGNEVVNYTHNGYVLVLAQYGIFGFFWCYLILIAFRSAIRRRDIILCSCIVALMLYYMGMPRHINFQLFPFVGVLSVFLALGPRLTHSQKAIRNSRAAADRKLRAGL